MNNNNQQILSFGDIIYLQVRIPQGIIYGDGIGSNKLKWTNDKDPSNSKLRKSLFRIESYREYQFQQKYEDYLKLYQQEKTQENNDIQNLSQNSSPLLKSSLMKFGQQMAISKLFQDYIDIAQNQQQNNSEIKVQKNIQLNLQTQEQDQKLKTIQHKKDEEVNNNEERQILSKGKQVNYGQKIMLRHFFSNCFLTVNPDKPAWQGGCLEMQLQEIASSKSVFNSTCEIQYESAIISIFSKKMEDWALHVTLPREELQIYNSYDFEQKEFEVNASQIPSGFTIQLFQKYSSISSSENKILNGKVIQIFMANTNKILSYSDDQIFKAQSESVNKSQLQLDFKNLKIDFIKSSNYCSNVRSIWEVKSLTNNNEFVFSGDEIKEKQAISLRNIFSQQYLSDKQMQQNLIEQNDNKQSGNVSNIQEWELYRQNIQNQEQENSLYYDQSYILCNKTSQCFLVIIKKVPPTLEYAVNLMQSISQSLIKICYFLNEVEQGANDQLSFDQKLLQIENQIIQYTEILNESLHSVKNFLLVFQQDLTLQDKCFILQKNIIPLMIQIVLFYTKIIEKELENLNQDMNFLQNGIFQSIMGEQIKELLSILKICAKTNKETCQNIIQYENIFFNFVLTEGRKLLKISKYSQLNKKSIIKFLENLKQPIEKNIEEQSFFLSTIYNYNVLHRKDITKYDIMVQLIHTLESLNWILKFQYLNNDNREEVTVKFQNLQLMEMVDQNLMRSQQLKNQYHLEELPQKFQIYISIVFKLFGYIAETNQKNYQQYIKNQFNIPFREPEKFLLFLFNKIYKIKSSNDQKGLFIIKRVYKNLFKTIIIILANEIVKNECIKIKFNFSIKELNKIKNEQIKYHFLYILVDKFWAKPNFYQNQQQSIIYNLRMQLFLLDITVLVLQRNLLDYNKLSELYRNENLIQNFMACLYDNLNFNFYNQKELCFEIVDKILNKLIEVLNQTIKLRKQYQYYYFIENINDLLEKCQNIYNKKQDQEKKEMEKQLCEDIYNIHIENLSKLDFDKQNLQNKNSYNIFQYLIKFIIHPNCSSQVKTQIFKLINQQLSIENSYLKYVKQIMIVDKDDQQQNTNEDYLMKETWDSFNIEDTAIKIANQLKNLKFGNVNEIGNTIQNFESIISQMKKIKSYNKLELDKQQKVLKNTSLHKQIIQYFKKLKNEQNVQQHKNLLKQSKNFLEIFCKNNEICQFELLSDFSTILHLANHQISIHKLCSQILQCIKFDEQQINAKIDFMIKNLNQSLIKQNSQINFSLDLQLKEETTQQTLYLNKQIIIILRSLVKIFQFNSQENINILHNQAYILSHLLINDGCVAYWPPQSLNFLAQIEIHKDFQHHLKFIQVKLEEIQLASLLTNGYQLGAQQMQRIIQFEQIAKFLYSKQIPPYIKHQYIRCLYNTYFKSKTEDQDIINIRQIEIVNIILYQLQNISSMIITQLKEKDFQSLKRKELKLYLDEYQSHHLQKQNQHQFYINNKANQIEDIIIKGNISSLVCYSKYQNDGLLYILYDCLLYLKEKVKNQEFEDCKAYLKYELKSIQKWVPSLSSTQSILFIDFCLIMNSCLDLLSNVQEIVKCGHNIKIALDKDTNKHKMIVLDDIQLSGYKSQEEQQLIENREIQLNQNNNFQNIHQFKNDYEESDQKTLSLIKNLLIDYLLQRKYSVKVLFEDDRGQIINQIQTSVSQYNRIIKQNDFNNFKMNQNQILSKIFNYQNEQQNLIIKGKDNIQIFLEEIKQKFNSICEEQLQNGIALNYLMKSSISFHNLIFLNRSNEDNLFLKVINQFKVDEQSTVLLLKFCLNIIAHIKKNEQCQEIIKQFNDCGFTDFLLQNINLNLANEISFIALEIVEQLSANGCIQIQNKVYEIFLVNNQVKISFIHYFEHYISKRDENLELTIRCLKIIQNLCDNCNMQMQNLFRQLIGSQIILLFISLHKKTFENFKLIKQILETLIDFCIGPNCDNQNFFCNQKRLLGKINNRIFKQTQRILVENQENIVFTDYLIEMLNIMLKALTFIEILLTDTINKDNFNLFHHSINFIELINFKYLIFKINQHIQFHKPEQIKYKEYLNNIGFKIHVLGLLILQEENYDLLISNDIEQCKSNIINNMKDKNAKLSEQNGKKQMRTYLMRKSFQIFPSHYIQSQCQINNQNNENQNNQKIQNKCEEYYQNQVGSVEVYDNKSDQLHRIYFKQPDIMKYITRYIKDHLVKEANRDSDQTRIDHLNSNLENYLQQMEWNRFIQSKFLLRLFSNYWIYASYSAFILVICLNIILLISLTGNTLKLDDKDSTSIKSINWIAVVLQLILSICVLIGCLISNYQIIIQKEINIRSKKIKNKQLLLIFDLNNIYNFIYVIVSFLSLNFPLVYAFLLLDLIKRNPEMKQIIKSVTVKWKQLLLTAIAGLILIYIFSVIAYSYLGKFYEAQNGNYSNTLWLTFASTLNNGLRAGGGIADTLGQPSLDENKSIFWQFWIFSILFFIIINILMLNIIFGIIIDTFGELRDAKQQQDNDVEKKCFICGLQRSEIEIKSKKGWDYHLKNEHYAYNYIAFLLYLDNKEVYECTAIEKSIKESKQQIIQGKEKYSSDFYPIQKAIFIQEEENIKTQ